MKKIFGFLLFVIIIVAAIVLVNTIRYSGEIPRKPSLEAPPISDSAVRHMSEAVQIETVSLADSLPIDTAAYLKYRQFIERAYPLIAQKLPRKIFNGFAYLYTWEGKNKDLKPYVLMAHSDVVPVEPAAVSKWTVPPFSGAVKDSMIWGRGVVDDKGCMITILEAVEDLLRQNFQPEKTIYLSFGHDEEIAGRGAASISAWFKEQNIHPELVLDEGGEISVEQFPALKRPVAVIGVAEKGYLSFQLRVEKPGGHSSMPQNETAIDILAKGLVKLREKQMPFEITEPMSELLKRTGPGMPFTNRMALANQWLFGGMMEKEFGKDHVTNALVHTTIVPTIVASGIKDNVIPTQAIATVNSRNLPGDDEASVIAFMKKQINDERVQIIPEKSNRDASPVTSIHGPAFQKIEKICYEVMPDVVPVPYTLMGATDSRNFNQVSDGVIKFAASIDGKGYHGIDERLPISDLKRMIFFYSQLIKESGSN